MITRRKFATALCSLSLSLVTATLPLRLDLSGPKIELTLKAVFAKDGNNGKGGGGGNDGGNGKGNQRSNKSEPGGVSSGVKGKGVTVKGRATGLEIRHVDGISEEIRSGRYIMKDARGRTIVNRQATSEDELRLQSLLP
jgi:hypothetical protein